MKTLIFFTHKIKSCKEVEESFSVGSQAITQASTIVGSDLSYHGFWKVVQASA